MSNGISIEVTRKFESEREGEDLVLDVFPACIKSPVSSLLV